MSPDEPLPLDESVEEPVLEPLVPLESVLLFGLMSSVELEPEVDVPLSAGALEPEVPLESVDDEPLIVPEPVPGLVEELPVVPLGSLELDPEVEPEPMEPEPMEPEPMEPVEPEPVAPVEPSLITSIRWTFIVSPEPEKLARTWSPSLMSLIDARDPSFVTSVDESTFSVLPESVSVLLERSRFSTRPVSSLSLVLPGAEAVALPELPVLPEVLAELSVPVDPVLAEPLVDGVVEVPVAAPLAEESVDPVVEPVLPEPIAPLLESVVFPLELPVVAEPVELLSSDASVVLPAKVSRPAMSATAAPHPIFLIVLPP